MCGRFALGFPRPQILRVVQDEHPELNLQLDEWLDEDAFQPRFNIAPRSRSPVIRRRNHFDDRSNAVDKTEKQDESEKKGSGITCVMHTMKWGVVPHWSKHEDSNLNTINAKGENLVDGGGMWTSIKGKKRCVVVCQGYYEWKKKGKERIPHFTRHKDGKLMLLAGLYDSVILEGKKDPLYTFTIVTTDANKQLSWLHDRMPVILSTPSQITAWLDTSGQKWTPQVSKLVRPYAPPSKEHDLECYPVPKEVGKVSTESPTFIEPVSKRKDGIEAMFAKQSGKGKAKVEKEEDVSVGTSAEPSPSPTKPESASRDEKPIGTPTQGKRKRESPELSKEGETEPSVELVSHSHDGPSTPKKVRTGTGSQKQKQRDDPANSDESNLSSQAIISSSPRSPKKSPRKSMKSRSSSSLEQASPGNSKITNFFKKS